MAYTPDIGINTAGVSTTGGDVGTLADAATKHLAQALDASKGVAGYQFGWMSGTSLSSCASAWEDHMVDIASRLKRLAQDLGNAANAYDTTDVEAERRMRLALGDLGRTD